MSFVLAVYTCNAPTVGAGSSSTTDVDREDPTGTRRVVTVGSIWRAELIFLRSKGFRNSSKQVSLDAVKVDWPMVALRRELVFVECSFVKSFIEALLAVEFSTRKSFEVKSMYDLIARNAAVVHCVLVTRLLQYEDSSFVGRASKDQAILEQKKARKKWQEATSAGKRDGREHRELISG